MKKLLALLLTLAMTAAMTINAFAADYEFGTGNGNPFGTSTSSDNPVQPDPMNQNTRRNKDAALMPPPYGIFSGYIPTDPSSPYHNNLPQSGFVPAGQDLPATGDENYAPGSSNVSSGLLPSTSQTAALNTTPWLYDDGSIGTLYVASTKKTIKVYEGEGLDNLAKGAGHFASTSAWDGNVALASHNRSGYFGWLKDAKVGDKLTYTTRYGTRTYEVVSKTQVDEYDNTALGYSAANTLTLFTCVENVPSLRWCVVAREIK
jgi:sortase A